MQSVITVEQIGRDQTVVRLTTSICDAYGREVGGVAYIYPHSAGVSFSIQSTRNGEKYGALRPDHYAANPTAGAMAAKAKLTAMARRIEKVAAKHGGVYRTK